MRTIVTILLVLSLCTNAFAWTASHRNRIFKTVEAKSDIYTTEFADLTGWTDADVDQGISVAATLDGFTTLNQDSNTAAGNNDQAQIYRDIGTISDTVAITFRHNITKHGVRSLTDYIHVYLHTELHTDVPLFNASDGWFMANNSNVIYEVGTNINLVCAGSVGTGCWQTWTLDCTGVSGTTPTCDIYRLNLATEKMWTRIASDQQARYNAAASNTDGMLSIWTRGLNTSDIEADFDYITVGTGLKHVFTSLPP